MCASHRFFFFPCFACMCVVVEPPCSCRCLPTGDAPVGADRAWLAGTLSLTAVHRGASPRRVAALGEPAAGGASSLFLPTPPSHGMTAAEPTAPTGLLCYVWSFGLAHVHPAGVVDAGAFSQPRGPLLRLRAGGGGHTAGEEERGLGGGTWCGWEGPDHGVISRAVVEALPQGFARGERCCPLSFSLSPRRCLSPPHAPSVGLCAWQRSTAAPVAGHTLSPPPLPPPSNPSRFEQCHVVGPLPPVPLYQQSVSPFVVAAGYARSQV